MPTAVPWSDKRIRTAKLGKYMSLSVAGGEARPITGLDYGHVTFGCDSQNFVGETHEAVLSFLGRSYPIVIEIVKYDSDECISRMLFPHSEMRLMISSWITKYHNGTSIQPVSNEYLNRDARVPLTRYFRGDGPTDIGFSSPAGVAISEICAHVTLYKQIVDIRNLKVKTLISSSGRYVGGDLSQSRDVSVDLIASAVMVLVGACDTEYVDEITPLLAVLDHFLANHVVISL